MSQTEVAVVTLDPNPGTDGRFLTGSLTLSFLSGNTALQVRSSSSWRSRTGRTQLDRSIWTDRERVGDRKSEQKPSEPLLFGLSPGRRRVGICRPVDGVGLYGGAVWAVWPQTGQLHLPPGAASMSPDICSHVWQMCSRRRTSARLRPMRGEIRPLPP